MGAVGDAIAICVEEADELADGGAEISRAVVGFARGDEDGAIAQSGHADGVVQAGGEGGEAEILGVYEGAAADGEGGGGQELAGFEGFDDWFTHGGWASHLLKFQRANGGKLLICDGDAGVPDRC